MSAFMLKSTGDKPSGWQIKSRAHHCAGSGREFEEGDSLVSRLVWKGGELEREDFHQSLWTVELKKESAFHWKTIYRPPPPKQEAPFKVENAEDELRRLLSEPDPGDQNVIFILAVMLERKRMLLERGTQPDADGKRLRVYEHKESGETFLIRDPELQLEQIAGVQQEVGLRLGWIQPEPEESPTESETESPVELAGDEPVHNN